MRQTELWTGAVICLLGLVTIFYIIPAQTEYSEDFTLQPALYPTVAAWVITVMGALLVLTRLFGGVQYDSDKPGLSLGNVLHAVVMAVILGLAVYLFDQIGFVFTGMLLIGALMLYIGEYKPLRLIGAAVATPLVLYGIFEKLLEMPLP